MKTNKELKEFIKKYTCVTAAINCTFNNGYGVCCIDGGKCKLGCIFDESGECEHWKRAMNNVIRL